ncbi:hypothetical protein SODALDRAFT_360442 [Sodiomyces alkalinus F11]|uniref:Uncharacterized protein n=1 Tax=Sodiomyces alkalinus (strain CBS 110278 / VKM F-3762 / F11) TaxID=1314773 RepID=A0A3N2PUB1_SODAK|nr:hypothetical protein SODALDRAFT_360442 [Sodiomyces alkalinus F11]ROT38108.1 hypothetical protein SODALDRAFT_360442 [Sodiomyces alkalinus F11]
MSYTRISQPLIFSFLMLRAHCRYISEFDGAHIFVTAGYSRQATHDIVGTVSQPGQRSEPLLSAGRIASGPALGHGLKMGGQVEQGGSQRQDWLLHSYPHASSDSHANSFQPLRSESTAWRAAPARHGLTNQKFTFAVIMPFKS